MKKYLLPVCFLFTLIQIANAQSTGKLTGYVNDSQTGDPVIGANIIIEDTYYGAAADLDGKFSIYNIPPGTYNLVISSIGYQKSRVNGVVIKNNLTTRQDVKMTSEDISLGEEIVVEAEAPLVQKDLTSTSVTVTASEIKAMPVENINQVINLQAGVVDGHFRGGRSNEVAYLIDGVSVTDAFSNGMGIQVENSSIRQLEVISGTFNAEYGQAMSGVINIISNDGSLSGYESSVSAYLGSYYSTDNLYPNVDNLSAFQSKDFQLTLSGPVPGIKNLSFFSTGRYFQDDGSYYGQRRWNPEDALPEKGFSTIPTGDEKWVPMAENRTISGNLKLTYNMEQFKFSWNNFYDNRYSQGYNHVRKYSPDGRTKNLSYNLVSTFQATHIPNANIFHTTSISFATHNPYGYAYEDPFDSRYLSPNFGSPPSDDLFQRGGTENGRYSRFTNTVVTKWALTAQINDIHKLGTGFEFKNHHIFTSNSFLQARDDDFDFDGLPDTTIFYYTPLHTNDNKSYRKIPYELSAYVQDKIEYDIMIINLGFRVDYFEPNTVVIRDKRNPDRNPNFPGAGSLKDADAQFQVSPRFGVSFPITDEGVIHFSYGHFFQIPNFESIYANNDIPVLTNQLNNTYGNGNLKAQKTVMYELGLQQVLPYDIKVDATLYYRDIRNLLGVEIVNTYYGSYYPRFINRDYGNVRGIILSLDRRMSDFFSANLDYTYQIAKGNSSDPYQAIYYFENNLEQEKLVRPLDWDQRHTFNLNLVFSNQRDWTVSTIIGYGSGFPFTPDAQYSNGFRLLNDGIKPSTWNVDLRADKSFDFAGVRMTGFLLVYNILGLKNEYGVFASTGRANRDLTGELNDRPRVGDEIYDDYINDPGRYSGPRNIKFGVSFSL